MVWAVKDIMNQCARELHAPTARCYKRHATKHDTIGEQCQKRDEKTYSLQRRTPFRMLVFFGFSYMPKILPRGATNIQQHGNMLCLETVYPAEYK